MNRILNWIFGSFFRTFGRVLVYILLGFVLFNLVNLKDIKLPKFTDLLFINVSAETFTDNSRFSWYVYNGNNLLNSGQGLFTYQTNQASRTEFLYQYYTFYNQYYYDITLDITIDSGNWSSNANGCNIGIPGAATFTSYFTKDYSGDYGHLKCSVYNFTANQLSNLFINFYNNLNQTILYNVVDYELSIDAKENTNPTSESINQGFSSVINNQNNNTNSIINNQNNNTQSIIDNQNQNKQDIIDNQNANTDKEIESQKVCKQLDKNVLELDNKALNYVTGAVFDINGYGISRYISINESTELKVLQRLVVDAGVCFYNINKEKLSCIRNDSLNVNDIVTIPDNSYYFRFTLNKNQNKPQFSLCENGNQAIGDNLSDINSALTDDSPPTNLDSLNNSAGWLPPGPVDSILNLPLSFLTNLNSNLSKSCQPVNLPLPYVNKNLPLPCVNSIYNEINGLPNWINIIGTIASAFILFGYFINLYKYVDDTLTFRENNYIDNWSGV